jgi:hydrogenase/urease accessory protein HupE
MVRRLADVLAHEVALTCRAPDRRDDGGGVLGILQMSLRHTISWIAGSVLVLGTGSVFAGRLMSPWTITALVSLFGVCHGYAHGLEIPTTVGPRSARSAF